MSNLPVIIVSGEAGSGKDAISSIICKAYNGISVAQADPMKRFVKEIFGFSTNHLWGSSEMRGQPIDSEEYNTREGWAVANSRLQMHFKDFFKNLLPEAPEDFIYIAHARLERWFFDLRAHFAQNKDSRPSSRYILQTLGTEWGRSIKPTLWSSHAIDTCLRLLGGECSYSKEQGLVINKEQEGYGCTIISDGRFKDEILAVRKIGGTTIKIVNPTGRIELVGGIKGHASEVQQRTIPNHFYDLIIMNDKTKGLDKLSEQLNLILGKLPALAPPLTITGW